MDIQSAFLTLVLSFVTGAKLHIILGLIALDIVLGISEAIKMSQFEWAKLGAFYRTMVVPYVLGYLAIYIVGILLPGVIGNYIGQGLDYLGFGAIAGTLVASITGHVQALFSKKLPVLPPLAAVG